MQLRLRATAIDITRIKLEKQELRAEEEWNEYNYLRVNIPEQSWFQVWAWLLLSR